MHPPAYYDISLSLSLSFSDAALDPQCASTLSFPVHHSDAALDADGVRPVDEVEGRPHPRWRVHLLPRPRHDVGVQVDI